MDSSPPQTSGLSAPVVLQKPSLLEIFLVFASIAAMGFGGVLVFARREIVERRRWVTPAEFTDSYALCQLLPGPNIVNISIVTGGRFYGARGAVVAALGLMGPPVTIVLVLAAIYTRYADLAALQRILAGVSAAAIGLFAATIIKMALPWVREKSLHVWPAIVAVFVAVGLMRYSFPLVLGTVVPLNIALVWWMRR